MVVIASFLLVSLQRIVNILLTLLILGSLALFGVGYLHVPAFQRSWPVELLRRYGDPIAGHLASLFHLPGLTAYMPLAMAVILYLVIFVSDQLFGMLNNGLRSMRMQRPRKAAPAGTVHVDSEKARGELYKEYRKIEQTLKEARRKRCTFLSVDVVGSTVMKTGETEIGITSTFRAYEELLKRTFKATRAWKESWTPDGVMICYLSRDDAVEAAQTILEKLLVFNQRDNALKTRFEVRCGINEGDVVVFEDSDVEKLVEHVIDVAGHMQKHAKPGTLRLSNEVYEVLEDTTGFRATGEEVDGYQTYEWSPKPLEASHAEGHMQ